MSKKKKSIIKLIGLAILAISFIVLQMFSYFKEAPSAYISRTFMFNNIQITYPFFNSEEDYHIQSFIHKIDNTQVNRVEHQVNFVNGYTNILFRLFYNDLIVDYHSMFFDNEGNQVSISHMISNEDAIISKIKDYVANSHLRITNDAIMRADKSFFFTELDLEIFLTNYNNLGHISLIIIDYNEIIDYLNVAVNLRDSYEPLPERVPEYIPPVIPQERRMVAFSFDDGPSRYTTPLLDILERYDARASFFMLGSQMVQRPEVVLEVMLRGHEVGNHTTDHALLTRFRQDQDITRRINGANNIFREITGEQMRLFRPPYGGHNPRVQSLANMPIILWSVDSRDWESRDTNAIVNLVLNEIQDGDIVLFHDLYPTTIEAVEILLPILKAYNFEIVTVSELFTHNDIELLPGQLYRHAR